MSASLVGSEMCIRDSCCIVHLLLASGLLNEEAMRGQLVPWTARPPFRTGNGTESPGGGPVSYTHLRAHETSAHL
eukprot:1241617-Alexandrium_andersonii.AAC.1